MSFENPTSLFARPPRALSAEELGRLAKIVEKRAKRLNQEEEASDPEELGEWAGEGAYHESIAEDLAKSAEAGAASLSAGEWNRVLSALQEESNNLPDDDPDQEFLKEMIEKLG